MGALGERSLKLAGRSFDPLYQIYIYRFTEKPSGHGEEIPWKLGEVIVVLLMACWMWKVQNSSYSLY